MSRLLNLALLVAGLCLVVLCHSHSILIQENQPPDQTHEDDFRLAYSNDNFAFNLYRVLTLKKPNSNIYFSPLSVCTSLAVLLLGAHGNTEEEINKALNNKLTETSEAEFHQGFHIFLNTPKQASDHLYLSMGNAMFVQEGMKLLRKFKKDVQKLYRAEIFQLNFQNVSSAEKLINDYMNQRTQGEILNLISSLEPDTVMVLVNYMIFKGKWQRPFDPQDTYNSSFHITKEKSVVVPMMKIESQFIPYFRDEKLSFTIVELKYTNNASILFILPDEGKMDEVEAMLSPKTLKRWRKLLKNNMIDELHLPRFSISSTYNLEEVLPELGIREVFTYHADLSGITGAKNMMVSQMVHKAVINVAEEGTEGATAQGEKLNSFSAKIGQPNALIFNRPFLLTLLRGDGSIYFEGKLVNPQKAQSILQSDGAPPSQE
ncbi:PREDICTED: alpha-1-antichymotrypsin-like [Elephantulus edwardii]|uniref:alpha-1-antichymotrypsin-like n=1 Tax=Elephantulus edwardii TaxID=28737 RepID=UPI0003F0D07B|nr:PREDICTED: alpha-1-antichymotrypsin-like [Elephantulus edwardii]